jgi:predicted GTPase
MIQLKDLQEVEPIVPGAQLVHINELQAGDEFVYMGGDPADWNRVTSNQDDVITYTVGRSHIPGTNDKLSKTLLVWRKGKGVMS